MRNLFFDIDGTLLSAPGVGQTALEAAMRSEFAISQPDCQLDFGGKTDRDLVGQLLRRNGLTVDEESRGRVRRGYSFALSQHLTKTAGTIHPGVVELLDRLQTFPDVNLFVMTGNFPETARMKLETFDLIGYFVRVVGGDLDEDRDDLARRALRQLRRSGGGSDVIVIGDTANDVRCAKAIGARCLAVCTGSGTREDLTAAGAERVVTDLLDSEVVTFLTQ
ncbi:MAG: HAD hydrolase-like protein [Planctomycetota bacterium]